jgi:hypothetical protein
LSVTKEEYNGMLLLRAKEGEEGSKEGSEEEKEVSVA